MPTSKPLKSTLISFSLFLAISYILIGMGLIQFFSDENPAWYVYLILAVLIPLALFLTYRTFINYKVIEWGSGQIVVRYTIRNAKKQYDLSKVVYWKEVTVKTGKNSTFKELEILFDDHFKLTLGLKEYSNYSKIHTYLLKKVGKKKQEE